MSATNQSRPDGSQDASDGHGFRYFSETRPRLRALSPKWRRFTERACRELLRLDEADTRRMMAHLQGPQAPRNDQALPDNLRQIVMTLRAASSAKEVETSLGVPEKGAAFLFDLYAGELTGLNEPR